MPPKKEDLPSTLQRSSKKAQETFGKTLESAEESYGSGERASRTAFSSLKHSFEKVGDHWEEKDEKGPSDAQAAQGGSKARDRPKNTHGGVDVEGHTRDELAERAKKLGVSGTSKMKKADLAHEIDKANERKTRKAREK